MTTASAERDDWYERIDEPSKPSRVLALWKWLPLVLGLIVFEFTADPMLGIALAGLKFGVEEWRTAAWLWRTDPNRERGRTCGLFHAAYGFGKVALGSWIIGLLGIFLIAIFAQGQLQQVRVLFRQAWGGLLTMMLGLVAFFFIACLAIVSALLGRVRAWMSPASHGARATGTWPPPLYSRIRAGRSANRVRVVLILVALLGPYAVFLGLELVLGFPRNQPGVQRTLIFIFFVTLIVAARLTTLLRRRIMATSPDQCWPEHAAILAENA